MSIEAKIQEFSAIAANPAAQLKKFKDEGKKVVGVLPYYAPEELVYAAGMVPMGIWGSNDKTIVRSKEYCATSTAPSLSWLWKCCWTAPWISWML